jgi:para-nitrobenzyl esterase
MTESRDPTILTITQGTLRGSVAANGALVWRGVPYAAPPVGPLRWKSPRPPQPWRGERAAFENGQPCVQDLSLARPFADDDGDGLVGSEDCLYLNVFAPADASASEPLPVMYFIHGGGNVGGHNASPTYDGSPLAQRHRVVVVTVNYRLGMLGWFMHPALAEPGASADDRSGNWGTLDIIRGLEWVRENIAAFGGNPNNVTIFGESAGGINVFSLLVSPRAKGLFHRAIAQSGGLLCESIESACNYVDDVVPGSPQSSREIVNRFLVQSGQAPNRGAAKVLQDTLSPGAIAQMLRALTPRALIELVNPERTRLYAAPRVLADGAVLPECSWLDAFRAGRFHRVPFITGTNRDERRLYQFMEPRWRKTLREAPGDYVRYAQYGTMAWKQRAVDDVASAMWQAGHREIYTYRFDWDEQNVSVGDMDLSLAIGAGHSIELPFVFGTAGGLSVPLGDPEAHGRRTLSATMMSYWAQHAYAGAPGRGRDGHEVEWFAWDDREGAAKMMVLDTAADGGVRMSSELVTQESLKQAVLNERGFQTPGLHALLYRGLFQGAAFRADEYQRINDKPKDSSQ